MKAIISIFTILVMANLAIAQQNKMPQQRPADFKVNYLSDGGMSYYFKDIVINADSCVYSINHKGAISGRTLKLSSAQLDDLYAMLLQNNFATISGKIDNSVYDRGGVKIEIAWDNGNQNISVSNSQYSFVADNYMSAWKIICTYLENIAV